MFSKRALALPSFCSRQSQTLHEEYEWATSHHSMMMPVQIQVPCGGHDWAPQHLADRWGDLKGSQSNPADCWGLLLTSAESLDRAHSSRRPSPSCS